MLKSIKIDAAQNGAKGSDEKHRDWIYMWYSRNGNNSAAKQFTRNQRYKLYGDGAFYDVQSDVLEKTPLKDDVLTAEQKEVRAMLSKALDEYRDKRPAHLGADPKKKSKKEKGKNAAK